MIVDTILQHPPQLFDHLAPDPAIPASQRPEYQSLKHTGRECRDRQLLFVGAYLDRQRERECEGHTDSHEVKFEISGYVMAESS